MYRIVSRTISIGVVVGFCCNRGRIDFNFFNSIFVKLDFVGFFFGDSIFVVDEVLVIWFVLIVAIERERDRAKKMLNIIDVDDSIYACVCVCIYIDSR